MIKSSLYLLALLPCAFLLSCCTSAEERALLHESGYLEESPLPTGYPMPGPYGEITKKSYPAYRAAVTDTDAANRGFWTLFRHIKRQNIEMTAPVEMKMSETDKGELEMVEMAFLYRHTQQGQTGKDGNQVEVLDLPKMQVLNYAWQGSRSNKFVNEAKAKLIAEAGKQNLKYKGFRLLGYNSPMIPNEKKTHELQLILE
ncbi:MAG: heme-binding protein [Luteolibacter sp.]